MIFAEQPPSKQWAALKFRGEKFAEVWFKPEGKPFDLTFRIPQGSFQIPEIGQRLTVENLLKAVGVTTEQVESWRVEGALPSDANESHSELSHPLPLPSQDVTHLDLCVSLKPPQTITPKESVEAEISETEIPESKWQYFEGRWKAILGLEASMESLRMSMEGLRSEMEASSRKALQLEVKVNALSADVVQWNKTKSRIQYALPKVREFIHRSIWATGTAERKKFAELFENHIQPRIFYPQIDEIMSQFEGLLKDRQTLYSQGMSVYQECKGLLADYQGTLRTLQSNAAANASRKGGRGPRGKTH